MKLARTLPLMILLGAMACENGADPTANSAVPQFSDSHLPPGAIAVNTCGAVLSTPGDYWVTKDLTCGGTHTLLPVIQVGGTNVTLHLNNHTLRSGRNPIPETSACLTVGGTGNTVVGPGQVGGFCDRGISLSGSHNTLHGLRIFGWDLALELNPGFANTVEDVTFIGAGYAAVYGAATIDSLVLRRNTVNGNYENGFKNMAGTNQVIEYNTLFNVGFAMTIGGTGSTIRGNKVLNAGDALIVTGTGLTIIDNIFRHNSWDITDKNANPCVVNHYANNIFARASDSCIQ